MRELGSAATRTETRSIALSERLLFPPITPIEVQS